jgi:DNA-binding NarL/FixJ family response regulator
LILLRAAELQLEAVKLLHEVVGTDEAPTRRLDGGHDEGVYLTPREKQVLGLLGQGLTNVAISQELGISSHTVRTHLQAIFRKLGASQRTEAIVLAMNAGLLDDGNGR